MGSWLEAVRHFLVGDQTVPILIQLVEHNEHLIFGDGELKVDSDCMVKIIAVNAPLSGMAESAEHFEAVTKIEVRPENKFSSFLLINAFDFCHVK